MILAGELNQERHLRSCVECGERIAGRIDKRYCSDACRTAWHNRERSSSTTYMRSINSILRKNRRILTELRDLGKRQVAVELLQQKGFAFGYLTHIERRGRTARHYCYERGYVSVGDGKFLIV